MAFMNIPTTPFSTASFGIGYEDPPSYAEAVALSPEKPVGQVLAKACGVPVDQKSIQVLSAYGVPFLSIAARTDKEIQQELKLLLDNDLTLLQDPSSLDLFLAKRLKKDSWEIIAHVREYVSAKGLDGLEPDLGLIERQRRRDVGYRTDFAEKDLPPRARATYKAVKFIKDANFFHGYQVSPEAPGLVCHSDQCENHLIPVRFLALPPYEVIKEIRSALPKAYDKLDITSEIIPSGIGSLNVSDLAIHDSSCSSLPISVERLPLASLQVDNSPHLQHIPEGLKRKHSIQTFRFYGLPEQAQILEEIVDQPIKSLAMNADCFPGRPLRKSEFVLPQRLAELDVRPCTRQALEMIRGENLQTLSMRTSHKFDYFPKNLLNMPCLKEVTVYNLSRKCKDGVVGTLREHGVVVWNGGYSYKS